MRSFEQSLTFNKPFCFHLSDSLETYDFFLLTIFSKDCRLILSIKKKMMDGFSSNLVFQKDNIVISNRGIFMGEVKNEKAFYEKWWFWVIMLIFFLGIIGSNSTDTTEEPQENNVNEVTKEISSSPTESKKEKQSSSANEQQITKEQFEQLHNGMTLEEVLNIIGSEGEVISESGTKGERGHYITYEYSGDDYASVTLMFEDNVLISRSQFGLGFDSDIEVTVDQFNELQTGMTYEEVTKLLGGEGELVSEFGLEDDRYYSAMYAYPGKGDKYAEVTLTFENGRLENKSQYGLK